MYFYVCKLVKELCSKQEIKNLMDIRFSQRLEIIIFLVLREKNLLKIYFWNKSKNLDIYIFDFKNLKDFYLFFI